MFRAMMINFMSVLITTMHILFISLVAFGVGSFAQYLQPDIGFELDYILAGVTFVIKWFTFLVRGE